MQDCVDAPLRQWHSASHGTKVSCMTTTGKDNGSEPTREDLIAALQFYDMSGVDCCLDDQPIDRFVETRDGRQNVAGAADTDNRRNQLPPPSPASSQTPQRAADPAAVAAPSARVPDDTAIANAREAARLAGSIDALREALAGFNDCNLRFGARSTVFADGNPEADVMFIGEAPGRDEDRQGLPFVGRAGQLLDKMLLAIGLDRTSCYITNIIPWRPPGNRTPTPHEIELCRPFIERHVVLAAPKVVVLMGNVSTKSLLGTTRGILSLRGTWSSYRPNSDTEIPAMPTLHPAYLLRNPAHKRLSWQDFLSVRMRLDASDKGDV